MKKAAYLILICLLVCLLAVPAMADPVEPRILLQPQNYQFPQYGVAMYTVKAEGNDLQATWYLEYNGHTYNLSDNTNGMEPWEAYAGESYGGSQPDANTFVWFFGGIEPGLNGAQIWCVIGDGHSSVTSSRAIISVQGDAMPPEILDVPAEITAFRGDSVEIRCLAKANEDTQLEYLWYESATGKLQDCIAMYPEETADFLVCSTEWIGTRYYVCCVTSSEGGRVYSSVIPVTVLDFDPEPPEEPEVPATEAPTTEAPTTEAPATEAPSSQPSPQTPSQPGDPSPESMPWWGVALIAVAATCAGAGAAVLLSKKKS